MSSRSGFRKTAVRRTREAYTGELTLTFTLPPALSLEVAPGAYNACVTVLNHGGVQVKHRDREYLFRLAMDFLRGIGKGHGTLQLTAVLSKDAELAPTVGAPAQPGYHDSYRITIATGNPVVVISRTAIEPAVMAR